MIPFRSFVGELFFGVVALQMSIQKNHYTYMCERGPFPRDVLSYMDIYIFVDQNNLAIYSPFQTFEVGLIVEFID